ncbi:membrane protein [Brevibacillus laterosporus]|nr:membrane protein [Brevibacillus laterosporus]
MLYTEFIVDVILLGTVIFVVGAFFIITSDQKREKQKKKHQ